MVRMVGFVRWLVRWLFKGISERVHPCIYASVSVSSVCVHTKFEMNVSIELR